MAKLRKWTMPDSYFGETWPDYYSSSFGQSRDSDCLERTNFRVALEALGGESETVIVVRESHWAVGWVEWIAIHESDEKAIAVAEGLLERFENYPSLDDDALSEAECEEANKVWQRCYDEKERIAYIRRNRSQFEFHDLRDMIACVRGEYFAGYASELIYG